MNKPLYMYRVSLYNVYEQRIGSDDKPHETMRVLSASELALLLEAVYHVDDESILETLLTAKGNFPGIYIARFEVPSNS